MTASTSARSLVRPERPAGVDALHTGIVVGAVAAAYALIATLAGDAPYPLNEVVVQPLAWLLPAGVVLVVTRLAGVPIPRPGGLAIFAAGMGLFQATVVWMTGLASHFGRSPLAHDPVHLAIAVWYIVTTLTGREMARWYLARTLTGRHRTLGFLVPWLLLTVAAVPPPSLLGINSLSSLLDVGGTLILPSAGSSLLATQLAMHRGPLASMPYLAVLAAMEWFPPILPSAPWPMTAFVGVVVPLVLALKLDQGGVYATLDVPDGGGEAQHQRAGRWVLAGIVPLFVVWCTVGLFGFKPIAIDGVSMEPGMHTGDLAVMVPVEASALRVGDIVSIREGTYHVIHRIVTIDLARGLVVVRGDNNDQPDPPQPLHNVEGRMTLHAPYVGWVLLLPRLALDRLVHL